MIPASAIDDLPARMARLPRDRRGYPVPVIVLRDRAGRPHFTINDELKRQEIIKADRCAICGGKLLRGRWFVGGAGSMLHDAGVLVDTGLHDECAHYALRVCPYLAAPSYAKRIDAKTLAGDDPGVFLDPTVDPTRPEVFVAGMAIGQELRKNALGMIVYVRPKRPYRTLEFWRHGIEIERPANLEAMIADAAVRGTVAEEFLPRLVRTGPQARSGGVG